MLAPQTLSYLYHAAHSDDPAVFAREFTPEAVSLIMDDLAEAISTMQTVTASHEHLRQVLALSEMRIDEPDLSVEELTASLARQFANLKAAARGIMEHADTPMWITQRLAAELLIDPVGLDTL